LNLGRFEGESDVGTHCVCVKCGPSFKNADDCPIRLGSVSSPSNKGHPTVQTLQSNKRPVFSSAYSPNPRSGFRKGTDDHRVCVLVVVPSVNSFRNSRSTPGVSPVDHRVKSQRLEKSAVIVFFDPCVCRVVTSRTGRQSARLRYRHIQNFNLTSV
jgi:hypothetical protein